jgi:hypothetical protein
MKRPVSTGFSVVDVVVGSDASSLVADAAGAAVVVGPDVAVVLERAGVVDDVDRLRVVVVVARRCCCRSSVVVVRRFVVVVVRASAPALLSALSNTKTDAAATTSRRAGMATCY